MPFHNVSPFRFLVQLKECALCVSHPKADVYVDQMYAVYCKRVQFGWRDTEEAAAALSG